MREREREREKSKRSAKSNRKLSGSLDFEFDFASVKRRQVSEREREKGVRSGTMKKSAKCAKVRRSVSSNGAIKERKSVTVRPEVKIDTKAKVCNGLDKERKKSCAFQGED
jgi:hypothetical protein